MFAREFFDLQLAFAEKVRDVSGLAHTMPSVAQVSGCFSCAILSDGSVRLHFRNADADGGSPLSAERMARRRDELVALFSQLKASVSPACNVQGGSWLYNIDAYRRLFPSGYTASSTPVPGRFQSMALWGQFLDHRGQVKPALERSFQTALRAASTLDGLSACFPLQVLEVRAPLQVFFELYEI